VSSLAHNAPVFEIRSLAARDRAAHVERLRLLASGDGWSLIGPTGKLVFSALGTSGRRACLEFARARGILVVFS
jgi:hypothetical protein